MLLRHVASGLIWHDASGALDNLKELSLFRNQIGDTSMISFADALGKGALAALETLELRINAIGDAGMSALAKAITPGPNGKGALPQLKELNLYYNQIGDVGMQALAGAVSKGALAPGAEVFLGGNSVTETGKQAMHNAAEAQQRDLSVYF